MHLTGWFLLAVNIKEIMAYLIWGCFSVLLVLIMSTLVWLLTVPNSTHNPWELGLFLTKIQVVLLLVFGNFFFFFLFDWMTKWSTTTTTATKIQRQKREISHPLQPLYIPVLTGTRGQVVRTQGQWVVHWPVFVFLSHRWHYNRKRF